jgi:hypothetical protein
MMINDSGVLVPHIRSFPGTSNFTNTLGQDPLAES